MGILWSALLLGLAGSVHCAAMCGPIVLGLPFGNAAHGRLLYNAGRLTSYLIIGLVFGLIGQALHLVIYQQYLSIISGVLIIFILLPRFVPFLGKKISFAMPLWKSVKNNLLPKIKSKPKNVITFGLGLLNGFLPCGLVYIAASAALGLGNSASGLLYMFVFGLGTLPMMLGISFSGKIIPIGFRNYLSRIAPAMILVVACLCVVRGLALNIPYLSPRISDNGGKIESCCSHCPKK